ncbi:MAG: butyrate kinase [Lachnospiraceae bacterium]|nr:butyrate kinase [Lachnospiraceae bacterium]
MVRSLIINLGSTSTKIAVFEDSSPVFETTISHDAEKMSEYKKIIDQLLFRKEAITEEIKKAGFKLSDFDAICSRGGPLKPVESGIYLIDDDAVKDAADPEIGGRHPAALGVVIAGQMSKELGIPAYFVDPVSTDELVDEARYSGYKGIIRDALFHALNQKSMARKVAGIIGKPYEELNLIGVHMGGGVCVAAHCKGRVIDAYNVTDDGCFSMDRCGNLPTTEVLKLAYSGVPYDELKKKLTTQGGVYSYLGTKDFREVERRVTDGDEEARGVFNAMVFQHVKCIGAMAAIMKFKVDGIFLTGGIAFSDMMCNALKSYIDSFATTYILPGENEMQSLADGVMRISNGEIPKKY